MHQRRHPVSPRSDSAPTAAPSPPAVLVEVAVPVGVDRTFVYTVPPALIARARPGARVEVPLRRRIMPGVIVALAARAPAGSRLLPVRDVLDTEPALTTELLDFTRWVSSYYAAPWGEVLRAALPQAIQPLRRPRRREQPPAPSPPPEPPAVSAPAPPPPLTAEQARAVHQLERWLAEGTFRSVLLRGVTASGKTEVYLQATEIVLRRGGQVLVLVPEIGLSVQLVDRFVRRLGAEVAVLHSALTAAERRRQWERVRGGEVPVVIGARSAVFAPLARLALVIVDEEHEVAYKQDEVPRYHGRDVAVVRARMNRAMVLLGSATPSLESAFNAARGRYDLLTLDERVDGRPLPQVTIADMRALRAEEQAARDAARRARSAPPSGGTATGRDEHAAVCAPPGGRAPEIPLSLSPLLRDALARVLSRGEQAILLVHRRGHSSFVQCTDCGAVARCPACAVALTYHAVGLLLRCHHCNLRRQAPDRCPSCDGARFWYGGVGTQRVEAELRREFAAARVLRMDFDSTRRRGSHRAIVEAFAAREADILLGTQMVAKGLDFPEVSLVGVVSADTLLNLPDFRSGERSFQLLTQVAGRAGRGSVRGEVIIQTYLPAHPSVVAAATHDYEAFYAAAIAERAELGYPPCGAMARFHLDGPEEETVVRAAEALGAALGSGAADLLVLGPAPLPLRRLRGRERWHVTLLGRERRRVHAEARRACKRLTAAGLPPRVRLQLDIDPIHLL